MKAGLSDALKARLWRPDCDAKDYTELVRVAAEDVRQTKAAYDAGTLTNVDTFEDGSVQLDASSSARIQNTSGTDLNPDIAEDSSPVHLVAWKVDDAVAAGAMVRSIAVRLSRRRVGGNPAFDGRFSLRVFKVFSAGTYNGTSDAWTLQKIADSAPVFASSMSADTAEVAFNFNRQLADVTNPPLLELDRMRLDPNPGIAAPVLDLVGARVIVVQVVAHGGDNDNYAWLNNDAGASAQTTALAGTLYHRLGTQGHLFTDRQGVTKLTVAIADAVGMPRIIFSTAAYAATGTIAFSGADELDLGGAVQEEVEFVARGVAPSGTSVLFEASDDGGANWSTITDGCLPSEASPALTEQDTYEMRATLSSNGGQDATPTVFAMGIRDRVAVDVTDLVSAGSWESVNEQVNPLTGEVQIGEAEIGLIRNGDRDYRGIEQFLSENDFASVEVRTFVGHPDLPRRQWLFCDLWRLDDYWLEETEARLLLVAVTERLKGTFPAAAGTRYGYLLKAATPSGVTSGADFTRELSVDTESSGSISPSVAASATESSYGYTPANIPNLGQWPAGRWTLKVNVTAAHANIYLKVKLARVSAAGTTVYEDTEYSEEQQLNSTGVKTFTFNLVEWPDATGRAATNRLRVEFCFRNSDGGGAHSVTIETGTVNSEIITPWTPTNAVEPVSYISETVRDAFEDWRDNRVALDARYRGDSPPNTVDTVSVQLLDVDGKRQLERFAFLDGGIVIPSQGKVTFRNLWKSRAAAVAVFPMEEFPVTLASAGFRARVPRFEVPFGFDGGKFMGVVRAEHATALEAFGVSRIDNPDRRLEDRTAMAIEGPKLAGEIATSVVVAMGFGMILVEGRPTIPHPELELGDAVLVETDRLALKDPLTGLPIRGATWCFGVVQRIGGLRRNQLTIWVRGLYDLFNTNTTTTRREPYEVVLVTPVDYSTKDRPDVARFGFRSYPDNSVTIRYCYRTESQAIPHRDTSNAWTEYTAGERVEFLRDSSSLKYLHAYGTYNGVQGPVVSVPVEHDARASISNLRANEPTVGTVRWYAEGVDQDTREIRWYIRRNAASGMYPTTDNSATGPLDETYLIGQWPIAADRGGRLYAEQTGYGAGDDSSVIAVPIDANGNPGPRSSATYAYTATPSPGLTSATVTLNTAGSSASSPRTYDLAWTQSGLSDTTFPPVDTGHRIYVYVCVDDLPRVLVAQTSYPVTASPLTNQGIPWYAAAGEARHRVVFEFVVAGVIGNSELQVLRVEVADFNGLPV